MNSINKLIVKIRKEIKLSSSEIRELARKKLNINLATASKKTSSLILTKEEEKIKQNLENTKLLMEQYLSEYDYTEKSKEILEDRLRKLLVRLE